MRPDLQGCTGGVPARTPVTVTVGPSRTATFNTFQENYYLNLRLRREEEANQFLERLYLRYLNGCITYDQYLYNHQGYVYAVNERHMPQPVPGYTYVLNDGNDAQVCQTINGREYDSYDTIYGGGGYGAPCA